MPELPEVETVRRGLQPVMEGAVIARAEVNRPDLRWPLPDRMADRLTGKRVTALRRRSKYLLADLSTSETLLVHLGMSGRRVLRARLSGFDRGAFARIGRIRLADATEKPAQRQRPQQPEADIDRRFGQTSKCTGHTRPFTVVDLSEAQAVGIKAGLHQQKALEHLERFFFQGHDKVTGKSSAGAALDVETQALLRLMEQVEDAPASAGGCAGCGLGALLGVDLPATVDDQADDDDEADGDHDREQADRAAIGALAKCLAEGVHGGHLVR